MGKIKVNVSVPGTGTLKTAGRGVIGMVYFDTEETESEMTISGRYFIVGNLGAMDVMALLDGLDKSFSSEDRNVFFDGLEQFLMMKMKGALRNGD